MREASATVCVTSQGRGYRLEVLGLQPGSDATVTWTDHADAGQTIQADSDGSIHGTIGSIDLLEKADHTRSLAFTGTARDGAPVDVTLTLAP